MKFPDWIVQEMNARDWSQSDLARQSGLTRQAVSHLIAGRTKNPDKVTIEKLARAFDVSVETVIRAAGILPAKSKRDELIEEAEHLFSQLESEDSKQIAINFLRMLQGNKKKDTKIPRRSALENK